VVVVLEPRTPREFAPQSDKPVMDQVGQAFGPEVLLVRTGEPVEFRNSDDTLHNVRVSHEETRTSAFNVAIPTGEAYTYTFERDGFPITLHQIGTLGSDRVHEQAPTSTLTREGMPASPHQLSVLRPKDEPSR